MELNNNVIGLYGIGGVYNYGCEAIIRGTEIILKDLFPDVEIRYASLRPKDDKNRLSGSEVNIVNRTLKPFPSIARINNIFSINTGHYIKHIFPENLDWTEECDIIFSIGGDLYTLPSNHKNGKVKHYYNPLIHFGNIMMDLNKKYVIWGASIGPFEKDMDAKKLFIEHLRRVNLIASRECVSSKYLNDNGVINNVKDLPDPAFVLKEDNLDLNVECKNLTIGINLSPISSNYVGLDDNKSIFIDVIKNIINKFNANIVLIPHVVCNFDIMDDDFRYLKSIYDQLNGYFKEKVELISNDPGYLGIRDVLKTCDLVIGSRMHCCINSLSLGIPTIFLSYSEKSLGMSHFVYNNNKFVFPLKYIKSDSFLNLINYTISNKEQINKQIIRKLTQINYHLEF